MPHLVLLYREDDVAVGCWMWRCCIWWFCLETGEEVVQLLRQRDITFSSPWVGLVVGNFLDSLLYLPGVVAVQVVLDPPPVIRLRPPDAPLETGACCAVQSPIT